VREALVFRGAGFGILSLPLIDCGGASTAASEVRRSAGTRSPVTATSAALLTSAIFQLEVN